MDRVGALIKGGLLGTICLFSSLLFMLNICMYVYFVIEAHGRSLRPRLKMPTTLFLINNSVAKKVLKQNQDEG